MNGVSTAHELDSATLPVANRWAARAVPLVILAFVAASTVLWGALAFLTETPWIFPDELLYAEMAKTVAAGGLPAVRDVATADYGLGYPLLLAPAWAISADAEGAFVAARVINAATMSLAAIPAFLLARRFVPTGPSLVVAALAVGLPSMAYAGTLLTEVALYPTVLLALLTIVLALERPSLSRQLWVLAAVALAFAVKSVAVALVVVYVAAIVIYSLLRGGRHELRRSLGRYKPTWLAIGGAAAIGVVTGVVVERDPAAALGAYAVVLGHLDAVGTVRWFFGNLSALALYVAVIPFAASLAVVVGAFRATATESAKLFAAVVVPTIVVVVGTVAAFGSETFGGAEGFTIPATSLRERNIFVVSPLLLLGLAIWLQGGRAKRVIAVASVVTLALVLTYPWSSVPVSASPQNLAPILWVALTQEGVVRLTAVGVFAVLMLTLLRFTPGDRIGRIWLAVGAVFVITGLTASLVFANASRRTLSWGLGREPSWIDSAVPAGEEVAVVWYEPGRGFARPVERHRVVWVNEFFNRSLGPVYTLGGRTPYALPETRARLGESGNVLAGGTVVRARFVLTCGVPVAGRTIARDRSTGAVLVATEGVLRVTGSPTRCPGGVHR